MLKINIHIVHLSPKNPNGLTELENVVLAQTPHVDQAIAMILRGLFRLVKRG